MRVSNHVKNIWTGASTATESKPPDWHHSVPNKMPWASQNFTANFVQFSAAYSNSSNMWVYMYQLVYFVKFHNYWKRYLDFCHSKWKVIIKSWFIVQFSDLSSNPDVVLYLATGATWIVAEYQKCNNRFSDRVGIRSKARDIVLAMDLAIVWIFKNHSNR